MKRYVVIVLAVCALNACVNVARKDSGGADIVSLYRNITQQKSQLDARVGEPMQFSHSEKLCISATCKHGDKDCSPTDHFNASPLMAGSDHVKYYGLSQGSDGYSRYSRDSQYAADVRYLRQQLDELMASFYRTGLVNEVMQKGMVPALMFDIDNTLEFSAGPDSDSKGDGPPIQDMVDFVSRWCFKEGVVCYFITARNCDAKSVEPTSLWLKNNLHLSGEFVRRYTYFSRDTHSLTCDIPGSPSVAYKDVIREALEREQRVFWLMSIGDQLTDSLGEHSGMKIRVPNQFFNADVAPNQDAPWGVGQCGSPNTIAPPVECAKRLVPHATQVTNLDYCSRQAAP